LRDSFAGLLQVINRYPLPELCSTQGIKRDPGLRGKDEAELFAVFSAMLFGGEPVLPSSRRPSEREITYAGCGLDRTPAKPISHQVA
jgi:hypothetical protein